MKKNELLYNKLLEDYRIISDKIFNSEYIFFESNEERKLTIQELKKKQIYIFKQIQEIINNDFKNIKNNKNYPDEKKLEGKVQKKIEEFEKICVDLTHKLKNKFPFVDKNSKNKSLIVETRNLNHLEFVIKNTVQKLGDGWGHIIFCNLKNYDLIKKICDDISENMEIKLLENDLSRDTYNNLFLDINFWEQIDCEKVLVYQTDTFIYKNLDKEFLKYDWIGMIWNDEHTKFIENSKLKWKDLWGCNGGLNLRTVPVIKEILKNNKLPEKIFKDTEKIQEDMFFSWFIKNKYSFPKKDECKKFSNDKIFDESIFGTHQPWNGSITDFIKFVKKIYNLN